MATMTAAEFLKAVQPNPVYRRHSIALSALANLAGYNGQTVANLSALQPIGGNAYNDDYPLTSPAAPEYDPAFIQAMQGYTFAPTSDTARSGYVITAPDGRQQVINWGDKDSGFDRFAQRAIPLAIGAIGAGAALGAFGGAGGIGSSVAGVGGEAAANLAAYGGTLTPAEIAATAGVNLGGAGLGGAGVAGAAGAAGAAGGAAGAGFWTSALKIAAPLLGSVAGGLVQSNAAGKAAGAQTAAARAGIEAMQKALAPYQQAGAQGLIGQQDLLGLNGPEKQQAAIAAIQSSPAFTSQQQLGENRILANASATGGLRGGNVQGALAQFSPALLSQLIEQQYQRLGGLTTTGANAAAGVGTATANLQGQIGSAQAGRALASGSALTNVLGAGFGALGEYLGQQQHEGRAGVAPAITTNTPFGQFQLVGGF